MVNPNYNTLAELYARSVSAYAKRPCFSLYGREKLTYSGFAERVEKAAELLKEYGLEAGDKVALLAQNSPNWPAAYFAAVTTGLVIVPILPDFSAAEVNQIVAHSEAKAMVVSEKQSAKLSPETIAALNVVIGADDFSVVASKEACRERRWVSPEIGRDSLAVIIYTSGTTSSPKGVMLSHRNLCAQLNMVLNIQDVASSDVFLSLLPLSHTYECSLGMLLPFMMGASVVYIDKAPTAAVLLPILREIRPTIVLSVPLIIEKIFKGKILPKLTEGRLREKLYAWAPARKVLHRLAGKKLYAMFGVRVRPLGVGGSKLDPKVERFLYEAKFPYAIGYGLTETAPLLAGSNPSGVRAQSTGPVLQGVELRIDRPNPETGEGEIVARGENIMQGYYKNPEATADAFTPDGWFRTKDLGVFDRDGYLFIKGRLGNMILGASGENIYPEEIEHVINEHPLVVESLVKEEKGRLVALVHFNREELQRKYNLMREELEAKVRGLQYELMQYVNARVNRFSRISLVVEQVQVFEKTPTQKIKRFLYK